MDELVEAYKRVAWHRVFMTECDRHYLRKAIEVDRWQDDGGAVTDAMVDNYLIEPYDPWVANAN